MPEPRDHVYGRLELSEPLTDPIEKLAELPYEARSDHLNRYSVSETTEDDLYWAVGDQTYDVVRFTDCDDTLFGINPDQIDLIVPQGAEETEQVGFRYTDHTRDIKPDALFTAAVEAIDEMELSGIEYNLMLDI